MKKLKPAHFLFFGCMFIASIFMISFGIWRITPLSEPGVLRSGPETETGKVVNGLYVTFGGFVMLISCIILIHDQKQAERRQEKKSFLIKCPSCGKKKEITKYGRYQCRNCDCKFEVMPDGTIVRISKI